MIARDGPGRNGTVGISGYKCEVDAWTVSPGRVRTRPGCVGMRCLLRRDGRRLSLVRLYQTTHVGGVFDLGYWHGQSGTQPLAAL